MGSAIEFYEGRGPVVERPIRSAADLEGLQVIEAEEAVPFVMEAIRLLRLELAGKAPLIGFSGAPFTLASYLVEGGGSKQYQHVKTLMYSDPDTYHRLMEMITDTVISYLSAQIRAGVQVVQLFDSWVGCLGPDDYREYAYPYNRRIFDTLSRFDVPTIHFANQASTLLEQVVEAGGDIIGVDWRQDLDRAWRTIGYDRGIQGNFEPVALFGPIPEIRKRVKRIIDQAENRNGHIFNLGHGILPTTPIDHARAMIDAVHEFSAR